MITSKDLEGLFQEPIQLELFEGVEDGTPKTPQQMVQEYHDTARLPSGVDISKEAGTDLISLRANLITEEFKEFIEEFVKNPGDIDAVATLKELADIVYTCYGCAVSFGWDLDMAVEKVHENNMGRMRQDDGSIHYREDGKVLKNPNYPKVTLEDCV